MTDHHHLAAIRGACRRYGHPEPEDLAGNLWLERVKRELDRLADATPPLNASQRDELTEIFLDRLASARHQSV